MNNHKNFGKAVEAVSPVVATLLLVLVAAGAAIGFGVFLNGFQKNTQENVSSEAPKEVLHIGGSSTVFEFTKMAIPRWDLVHPSVKIDNQEGGSKAGQTAVCRGLVDIGTSSSAWEKTGPIPSLAACPVDGNGVKIPGRDIHLTAVAYDAVVMAAKTGTCTSATGKGFTGAQVRELYAVNGVSGYPLGTDGVILPTAPAAGVGYTFGDLVTAGICDTTNQAAGTKVILSGRSDPGGTSDAFCSFLLNYKKDGTHCTNDNYNQPIYTFYTGVQAKFGNDGIRSFLQQTPAAMSYIGFGSVQEQGSDLKATNLGTTAATLVAPSASAIKAGAQNTALPSSCHTQAPSGQFCSARTLTYATSGAPSAIEQQFIDFVTSTEQNQLIAQASGYISIYA